MDLSTDRNSLSNHSNASNNGNEEFKNQTLKEFFNQRHRRNIKKKDSKINLQEETYN